VNLREVDLLPRIDAWLGRLTDPDHLEATCCAIAAASDQQVAGSADRAAARQLLADCDRRLARYRAALEAGTDPTVVGQWIAEVTTARQAAEASLHQLAVAGGDPARAGAGRWAGGRAGGHRPGPAGADCRKNSGSRGSTIRTPGLWFGRISVGLWYVSEGDLNPHALAGH
jgi:hypothetical protein